MHLGEDRQSTDEQEAELNHMSRLHYVKTKAGNCVRVKNISQKLTSLLFMRLWQRFHKLLKKLCVTQKYIFGQTADFNVHNSSRSTAATEIILADLWAN